MAAEAAACDWSEGRAVRGHGVDLVPVGLNAVSVPVVKAEAREALFGQ